MIGAGFIGAPGRNRRRLAIPGGSITAATPPATSALSVGDTLADTADWALFTTASNYTTTAPGETIASVTVNYIGATASATEPFADGDTNVFSITVVDTGGLQRSFFTQPRSVSYSPPVATGALADQSLTQGTGDVFIDVSGDFSGSGLSYAVTGPSGVTIDAGTGLLQINTDLLSAAVAIPVVITASNSGGSAQSGFGLTVQAAPMAPAQMAAPNVIATGSTTLSVTLAVDPDDSGAPIIRRDLRWRATGGSWTNALDITSPVTLDALTPDTNYEIQTRVANSLGAGSWSSGGTARTEAIPTAFSRVVFVGASIIFDVYGSDLSGRNTAAEAAFAAAGATVEVYANAQDGEGAGAAAMRLTEAMAAFPSDTLFFVHTGGNNVTPNRPYPGGAAVFEAQMNALVDIAATRPGTVILSDLTFRDYDDTTAAAEGDGSKPYNDALLLPLYVSRKDALVTRAYYADGTPVSCLYEWSYANRDLYLDADNIHPSVAGIPLLRDWLAQRLAPVCNNTGLPAQATRLTLDEVPPVLSAPGGSANGRSGATALGVTTNENGGTLSWGLYPAAAAPSAGAIVSGSGAVVSGAQPVSAAGVQTVSAQSGLAASTGYRVHYVHEDAAGNRSTPVASAAFVTDDPPVVVDVTPPVLSAPGGSANGQSGATALGVTTNESGGTLSWGLYPAAAAPSAGAIVSGSGAVVSGAQPVSAAGVQTVSAQSGLAASTGYRVHYVHEDAAGNRSTPVASAAFVTDDPPVVVDVTPPVLSAPGGSANGQSGATALGVATNESGGTLSWGLYPAAAAPSAGAIVSGSGAVVSGAQPVSAAGVQTVSAQSGLAASTGYRVHYVHEDAAGNRSTPVASAAFVTDDPPALADITEILVQYGTNTAAGVNTPAFADFDVNAGATSDGPFDLLNRDGTDPGVALMLNYSAPSSGDASGFGLNPFGRSTGVTGFDGTLYNDVFTTDNYYVGAPNTLEHVISGLDPDTGYTVELVASRAASGSRETRYSFSSGQTATLETTADPVRLPVAVNAVSDGTGVISITQSANTGSWSYIGGLRIIPTPAAPDASFAVEAQGAEPVITAAAGLVSVTVQSGPYAGTYTTRATDGAALTVSMIETTPTPVVLPTISGTQTTGQTLTATPGLWLYDGPDPGDQTWQWVNSADGPVNGATELAYVVQSSDSGDTVTVEETFGGITISSDGTSGTATGGGTPGGGTTPGGAFDPYTSDASLIHAWDASDTGSISGSPTVTQITDKVGSITLTAYGTPTTGTRTQNGLNVIDIDGQDGLRSEEAGGITAFTGTDIAFHGLHVHDSVNNAWDALFGWDSNTNAVYAFNLRNGNGTADTQFDGEARFDGGHGTTASLSGGPFSGAFTYAVVVDASAGTLRVFIDGVQRASTSLNALPSDLKLVWGGPSGQNFACDGALGELLVTNDISAQSISDYHTYLSDKWTP